MKRILIISYFFPPCNLTASQRVWGWVKYLHKYGYYPTVVTRNWQNEIHTEKDIAIKAGGGITVEEYATHEVYYIPHKPNFRDRLLITGRFPALRKVFTFIELIGQNFSTQFLSYRKFLHQARKLHKTNNYEALIISGNPFHQFFLGYKFHKKTKKPWIADYRDDWSTDELNIPNTLPEKLVRKLDRQNEKKWVGTASKITSVSPYYVQKISGFTGTPGSVIYNGFFEGEFKENKTLTLTDEFRLLYNGTLYPSQSIEVFFEGLKLAIDQLKKENIRLKILFPGVLYKPDQGERVRNLMRGYEVNMELTNRLPRKQVLQMQEEAHAFLMFAHKGIKGIPSSKIYEYLGYKKPILLSPGDNDILEEIIKETDSGLVCNSSNDVYINTMKLVEAYKNDELKSLFDFHNQALTRKNQAKKLAKLLDSIIE